jgi:hydrogenase maturation protease
VSVPQALPSGTVVVLGLGNPILGDDGVGWRVVEEARNLLETEAQTERRFLEGVEFDRVSLGGLSLMERLVGHDSAVLVDAIQTRDGVPGAIYRLSLDDLPTLNADSAHDASLKAALTLGRRLGAKLPDEIVIFAVEVADPWSFGETLSPEVASSVIPAAQAVLRAVRALEESRWSQPNS